MTTAGFGAVTFATALALAGCAPGDGAGGGAGGGGGADPSAGPVESATVGAADAAVAPGVSDGTAGSQAPVSGIAPAGPEGADGADSPGPLDGTVYVVDTPGVIGVAEVAELMPVPLEDTEDAAFHTAFMLINTADDVYAAAPEQPGDLSYFAAISAPECGWCASVLDTATTSAAASLRVTGGGFAAVGDSFDGGRMEDGSVVVNILVDEEPTLVWNTDGTLAASTAGGVSTLNLQLEWRTDMWKVVGVSTT